MSEQEYLLLIEKFDKIREAGTKEHMMKLDLREINAIVYALRVNLAIDKATDEELEAKHKNKKERRKKK